MLYNGTINQLFMRIHHNNNIIVDNLRQMDYINIPKLLQLLKSTPLVNQNGAFQQKDKKFNVVCVNAAPEQILELAIKINKRETSYSYVPNCRPFVVNTNWVLGELKLFIWIIMLYSNQKSINIENFSQKNYEDLQKIFNCRGINFIKYEVEVIISNTKKTAKEWRQQEEILLKAIIDDQWKIYNRKINWKEVSYRLYCDSENLCFRSLQQCRQRWTNYLDPNLKKTQWTITEDIILFNLVETFGCKWSQISQEMKGIRNEHMVKNRYYSYMNNPKFKHIKPLAKKMMKIQLHLKQQKIREKRYVKQQEKSCNLQQQYYETPYQKQIKMEEESAFYAHFNSGDIQYPFFCYNPQKKVKIEQPNNQTSLKQQYGSGEYLMLQDQMHSNIKGCEPTKSQLRLPFQNDSQ